MGFSKSQAQRLPELTLIIRQEKTKRNYEDK